MRLLVMTLLYPPDGGPSAPLFGMLCETLARRGMDVTVIAAVPHYPTGRVPDEFRRGWIVRSKENGVEVVRIRVPSVDRQDLRRRLFQFASYQAGAAIAGFARRYDAVLVSNPALVLWLPFAVHVVLRRTPAVFSIADVYPDIGVSLGVFRSPATVAAVEALERFCLKHSSAVRIISESFTPAMRRLGVPDSKISLIYDYTDTEFIRPLPRANAFAAEHGLDGRFVVLYAGNIGLSQGLEGVLDAAERLRSRPEILFVFAGDGAGRASLFAEAADRRLDNVRFLPPQSRGRLPEMLASADVGLVILKKGIGVQSLPNKTLNILASGRPLLASVDGSSATASLVERSGGGLWSPPEDPGRLADAVLALRDAPGERERMGRNGREYAVRHLSREKAADLFAGLFEETIRRSRSLRDGEEPCL